VVLPATTTFVSTIISQRFEQFPFLPSWLRPQVTVTSTVTASIMTTSTSVLTQFLERERPVLHIVRETQKITSVVMVPESVTVSAVETMRVTEQSMVIVTETAAPQMMTVVVPEFVRVAVPPVTVKMTETMTMTQMQMVTEACMVKTITEMLEPSLPVRIASKSGSVDPTSSASSWIAPSTSTTWVSVPSSSVMPTHSEPVRVVVPSVSEVVMVTTSCDSESSAAPTLNRVVVTSSVSMTWMATVTDTTCGGSCSASSQVMPTMSIPMECWVNNGMVVCPNSNVRVQTSAIEGCVEDVNGNILPGTLTLTTTMSNMSSEWAEIVEVTIAN